MKFENIIQLLTIIPVIHIIGIAHALHAVMRVRSSQGAIAWVISLITFPYIAVPLYWVLGRSKFEGYIRARRSGSLEINRLARDIYRNMDPFRAKLPDSVRVYSHIPEHLALFPYTNGNNAELLINGDKAFPAIFEAIEEAKEYILLQFYIVRDDNLGRKLKELLLEKAAQNVRIHFLYDEIGSHTLSKSYINELKMNGIELFPFKTTRGKGNRFQINFRNHRKIVIIDGKTAFLGGLNVGDEYMGKNKRFGPWRDTHMMIKGPAVQCIQLAFTEDWFWATTQIPALNWIPEHSGNHDKNVQVIPAGPADDFQTCNLMFVHLINAAKKRLWITSPYFVPDESVTMALQLAGLRGVDVRIILPRKPDHLLVYLSAFSYFEIMQKANVKLMRYQPGFMHQKVMLVDDVISVVGSANLDNRSFYLNFEISCVVIDHEFAKHTEKMLTNDMEQCRPVSAADYAKRSIWFKMAVQTARLMSPIQ